MEMVGHASIVYSVDSHVSGLIVSGSEDCSAKIWKGDCFYYLSVFLDVTSRAWYLGIATELIMSSKFYFLVKSLLCFRWSLCSEYRASWLCVGCQILGKWWYCDSMLRWSSTYLDFISGENCRTSRPRLLCLPTFSIQDKQVQSRITCQHMMHTSAPFIVKMLRELSLFSVWYVSYLWVIVNCELQ
jgi:hypothetical protein